MLLRPNVELTYNLLCAGGNRIKTRKRNLVMFQYGGTIGPARYPTFVHTIDPHCRHMLPRPVVKSRPGKLGWRLLSTSLWMKKLCADIEYLTIEFLKRQKSQSLRLFWDISNFARTMYLHVCAYVPPCLRICNTFFTQMILVGSSHCCNGHIPLHLDEDGHITALLSLSSSDDVIGGNTFYVEKCGDKCLLRVKKKVEFRHGKLHIGCYDSVFHGAKAWENCMRGVINFSMQKKILHHFYEHGDKIYKQFIDAGYPSGPFQAFV